MAMIHIIEATGLKPVMVPGGKLLSVMDPYCVIDFDDIYFGRTNSKKATSSPVWGETLEESIEDAQRMQITLFHSSLIPPDNFIAHSQIYVSELLQLTQGGHDEHEVATHTPMEYPQTCLYDVMVTVWSDRERELGWYSVYVG